MNAVATPADLLSEINRLFEASDWSAARELLQQAIDPAASQPDLHQLLGHCHLNLGDPHEAAESYATSASLAPQNAATHACLALALQLDGKDEPATDAARKALQLSADELIAMKVLARSAVENNRLSEGEYWCTRILSVDAGDENTAFMLEQIKAEMKAHEKPSLAETPDAELREHLDTLLKEVGFRRLQKLGFHLQKNDYYSPLNDCDFLEANRDLWAKPPLEPAGIEWRRAEQLALAGELSPYVAEMRDIPEQPPADRSTYGWKNNFWENADAMAQYGIVRAKRPRRYVEIGCGWSSLLLKQALARNAAEGAPCDVTLVEPYPNPDLFKHFPADWKIHRQMIQRADLEIFASLEAGDVLFYDGSHCSKVASDVNWFFFRVLPVVKPGVIIHIHDISLPVDYPDAWIFERGQTWNEQYVLQAFLMHNRDYSVLLANRYLFIHHGAELTKLYHGLQSANGCSFWMRKN